LHKTFHLAVRRKSDLGEIRIAASAGEPPSRFAALGGYGPRGAGEKRITMPKPGEPFPAAKIPLLGLDGSNGMITSHGDVANEHTARALCQQIFEVSG
jgi:hypothetical protein